MVPHKTKRGANALRRLKVYEGIPPPYDKMKRVCVPIALRQLCLRPDRKVSQASDENKRKDYCSVVCSCTLKRRCFSTRIFKGIVLNVIVLSPSFPKYQ